MQMNVIKNGKIFTMKDVLALYQKLGRFIIEKKPFEKLKK
jgi:hypothetical protein